jgi:dolichyl-diphosphooligosaccharide--protein glycosyltransferase
MSQSEATTNTIADNQGTRYVMTDIEMDTGKFWAMATWYNSSVGQNPYQPTFFIPTDPANPTSFQPATMYTGDYFMTMISRLHNFDGSLTPAGQVYYIEYTTTLGPGPYPVIFNAMTLNATEAYAKAVQYNSQAASGFQAAVVSPVVIQPTVTVPALNHYRLVHESPSNVFGQAPVDLKYVKIFEYVPGAYIKGEGIIELPVVTNTGRQFVWQAASENGEFIVPYSTEGNPYEVKATGKYRIVNTGREISVGEDAIMNGAVIG